MKYQLTTMLCILISGGILYAQDSENKIQKIKNAFQSEQFHLSGYGQIQYNFSEYPERSVSSGIANNSIDIVRAMLSASGRLGANNQFGYMLTFDFGPNARLFELYGEWLSSKAFNVRFGQFKIPFTIENPISFTRLETIHMSRPVMAMSGGTGDYNQWESNGQVISKTGRDAGLQLYGSLFPANDFFRLEYYAGLFNGTGMNTRDNNNRKDFIGTVYVYPDKTLKLGGSIYSGEYPQYMNVHLLGYGLTSRRWTIGAEYKGDRFCGRAEYITSKDGDKKRKGYYGLLLWKCVPDKWEVICKYDYYNKDTVFNDNTTRDTTIGVNYYFAYLSRIQLNYIYSDYRTMGKNHAVAAQLQLFF